MNFNWETSRKKIVIIFRGVFRTQSNVYDGAFSGKLVTAERCQQFLQKTSVVDVRLGSKYASSVNHQIPPLFHNSGILIYS